jgi:ATP-dependent Zn protease
MICIALVFVAGLFWMATAKERSLTTLTYSQFLDQVRMGRVTSVVVTDTNSGAAEATCRLKNGSTALTVLPSDYRDAMAEMQDETVNIEIRDASSRPLRLLINAMPVFLLLGLWIFMMNRKLPNGLKPNVLS